jgi:ribosomal protein S18 acetylase RimI-like enzyme
MIINEDTGAMDRCQVSHGTPWHSGSHGTPWRGVRRGEPRNAEEIAALILVSAAHFLPAVFGPGIGGGLRLLAGARGTLFSHVHAWICESDGRTGGMLLGYSGAQKAAEDLATGLGLLRALGPGLILRMGRLLRLQRLIGTLASQEYYVSNVAVFPEFRGNGLGTLLMEAAEKEARTAGLASVVLDVETDNAAAVRLYQGLGFVTTSETPRLRLESGEFAFFRMEKPLIPAWRAGDRAGR